MENTYVKITELYEKYKDSPKTINKLNTYINKHLPQLLEKCNDQEQKSLFLEKESQRYINEFLTDPYLQFFYISPTDMFIKYTGKNYEIVNEDEVWYTILTDITKKNVLVEWKQKIKNIIIKQIKNNSLFNTIPESYTVQQVIKYLAPTLLDNKDHAKYFLTLLGDNILGKNQNLTFFTCHESKYFLENLEQFCLCYFKTKLNITSNIKFKYRNQDYKNCRIIYFTKSIQNTNNWFHYMKHNLFNIIAVACHYSNRFKNSDKYLTTKNENFKNKVSYIKNNTEESIVQRFIDQMITFKDNHDYNIHFNDIYFLWKSYLILNNLPNMMYKITFETLIKKKIISTNNHFTGIESTHLNNIKLFKKFWHNTIIHDQDDEIEISELYVIFNNWTNSNKKKMINFSEEDFSNMIKHFYPDIIIEDDKNLQNVKCITWDKQKDIVDFLTNSYNDIMESGEDKSLFQLYVLYCNYTEDTNNLTVSKNYFIRYIDRVIPRQYISNNYILHSYFDLTSTSS